MFPYYVSLPECISIWEFGKMFSLAKPKVLPLAEWCFKNYHTHRWPWMPGRNWISKCREFFPNLARWFNSWPFWDGEFTWPFQRLSENVTSNDRGWSWVTTWITWWRYFHQKFACGQFLPYFRWGVRIQLFIWSYNKRFLSRNFFTTGKTHLFSAIYRGPILGGSSQLVSS